MAEMQLAQEYFDQLKEANQRIFELRLAVAERDRKLNATSGNAVDPSEGEMSLRAELTAAKAVEESLRRTISDLTKERNSSRSKVLRLEKELGKAKTTGPELRTHDLDSPSSLKRKEVEVDDDEPIPRRTKRPRIRRPASDGFDTDDAADDAGANQTCSRDTIRFKIAGNGLDVAEDEEELMTPELQRSIAKVLEFWRGGTRGNRWTRQGPTGVRPQQIAMCVTRRLFRSGTIWNHGNGKYACDDCVRKARPCFRWNDANTIVLLPLHEEDGGVSAGCTATGTSKWIKPHGGIP